MEKPGYRWSDETNSFFKIHEMTFTKEKITIPYIVDDKEVGKFTRAHTEGMQESLCPNGEDAYASQEKRELERLREREFARKNYLSEEKIRYNNLIDSIVDYDNIEDWRLSKRFTFSLKDIKNKWFNNKLLNNKKLLYELVPVHDPLFAKEEEFQIDLKEIKLGNIKTIKNYKHKNSFKYKMLKFFKLIK